MTQDVGKTGLTQLVVSDGVDPTDVPVTTAARDVFLCASVKAKADEEIDLAKSPSGSRPCVARKAKATELLVTERNYVGKLAVIVKVGGCLTGTSVSNDLCFRY